MIKIHIGMVALLAWCGAAAHAHVQIMVPAAQDGAVSTLDIRFVEHASENGPALPMPRPQQFGVIVNQKKTDLLGTLQARESGGQPAWAVAYTMKEAGAHVFFLQPAPYWEPAEQVLVVHYTKVILNSCPAKLPTESHMGWENWEGHDTLVGFPVEIEPSVQCTSLWTGSAFTGIVRVNGRPAPHCRVEVEYLNDKGAVKLPDNSYITHILKTDTQGGFTYVPARAGWWAMTAIPQSGEKAAGPNGKEVDLEMGGALWIRCVDM
ncbi:MAG: DUF4198 domain-containing protein [Candidatus Hydrogenedentes bacterium]|nr:DUF4198 domain-containing protein [Candidatus Hydrogenedentota bacterium]